MLDQYTGFYYEAFAKKSSYAQSIINSDEKTCPEFNIIEDVKYKCNIDLEQEEVGQVYVYVNNFGRVNAIEGESFFLCVTET